MELNVLRRNHLFSALGVGLLTLVVRLAFVSFYHTSPLSGGDPAVYWDLAQNIVAGKGFHSTIEPMLAYRPPLYSYFLASMFLLLGENRIVVFVAQAFIGSIAASLFFLCSVRILDERRGLVGGVLFGLFPHFLLFTEQVLTEALYISLFVALLAVLFLPNQVAKNPVQWILVGVLVGLMELARREALLLVGVIVIVVAYLLLRSDWRVGMAMVFVVLGAGLTLAPWVVRNWELTGAPVLSTSGGLNLLVGNNPVASGTYISLPQDLTAQLEGLDEVSRDRKAWDLAVEWIRKNPSNFLKLLFLKAFMLYEPASNPVLDGADLILVPFYLNGLVRLIRRQDNWQFVGVVALLSVVCITLVSLVFFGGWRFRLGMYPGLLMFAVYGIPDVWLERICQFVNLAVEGISPKRMRVQHRGREQSAS